MPVWIVCSGGLVQAQGEFLEKGQSGFAMEGYTETGEGNYALAASAGYSIGGIFDLGISFSKVYLNERDWGPSAEIRGWGPSLTLHLIKHSEMVPYSLGISAAYYKQYLQGGNTGFSWTSAESKTTLLGIRGLYRIPAGTAAMIIPGGGIAYGMGTVNYMQIPGITRAVEHDTYIEVTFSVQFSFHLGERHHLVFGPSLSEASGYFTAGFSLELVLGGSLPAAADKVHYKAGGDMDAERR